MSFDVRAWLEEEVEVHDSHEPVKKMPRRERLCFLIFANGGNFNVNGWGFLSYNGPNGHQMGLEQEQALDLLFYSGVFEGLHLAGVDFMSVLQPIFKEYIERQAVKTEPTV